MPANADAIGIESCTLTLAQKVRVTRKAEAAPPLLTRDGSFSQGATLGGDDEFTIEGKGDLPSGLALGVAGEAPVDTLSGVVIITSIEESEDPKDWNSWTLGGEGFPNAE